MNRLKGKVAIVTGGTSGMGRYHGRHSFDLFSHHRGVVSASTLIDHGLQEPPYTKLKERIIRQAL